MARLGQHRCSFCGKAQEQVRRLIAGPNVYICDECVALCQEMIAEQQGPGARPDVPTIAAPVQPQPQKAVAGHRVWFIPDGYLPPTSAPGELVSHEAVCVLNPGPDNATVRLTIYFEDREPLRELTNVVPGERTLHIRLDRPEHTGGQKLPTGVPYALRVESDVPIIVQHSRLDTTQPALALFTTMGYPQSEG